MTINKSFNECRHHDWWRHHRWRHHRWCHHRWCHHRWHHHRWHHHRWRRHWSDIIDDDIAIDFIDDVTNDIDYVIIWRHRRRQWRHWSLMISSSSSMTSPKLFKWQNWPIAALTGLTWPLMTSTFVSNDSYHLYIVIFLFKSIFNSPRPLEPLISQRMQVPPLDRIYLRCTHRLQTFF